MESELAKHFGGVYQLRVIDFLNFMPGGVQRERTDSQSGQNYRYADQADNAPSQ
jgi:hypothetical protein